MSLPARKRGGKKPRKSGSRKSATGRRKSAASSATPGAMDALRLIASAEFDLDRILTQNGQSGGKNPEFDHGRIWEIDRRHLRPSPENDRLYKPIVATDPQIVALVGSIRDEGVLESLTVSLDGYVISGHRRYFAAGIAGKAAVPCRVLAIRRIDYTSDQWLALLREHNRNRDKTRAEKLREELVSINPDEAHRALMEYRRSESVIDVKPIKIIGYKHRAEISKAKKLFLETVQHIINENRKYWPLTDRQIHYLLLNDPPLIHASKPQSRYINHVRCYKALIDLVTRARLERLIPFGAIGDETRPVEIWNVFPDVRDFIKQEANDFLKGYWRDLMQSQPNHIELIGEKNTVAPILKPIAGEYTIPMTTGRGYCSLDPRYKMAQRFEESGKDKLILLFVSDFDPEGEDIGHSYARSMRDDFGIDDIHPIKVALNAEQIHRHSLQPIMQAKDTSSRYKKFVAKHGRDVFELEALKPAALQQILRDTIENIIDKDALTAEIEEEKQDAQFLEGVRRTARKALVETVDDLELDDDDFEEEDEDE